MENPCKLVCFGDSITKSYAPILESLLKSKYPEYKIDVINAGVVSDSTEQALKRLQKTFYLIESQKSLFLAQSSPYLFDLILKTLTNR